MAQIFPPQQRLHSLAGRAMARSVKPIPADAVLRAATRRAPRRWWPPHLTVHTASSQTPRPTARRVAPAGMRASPRRRGDCARVRRTRSRPSRRTALHPPARTCKRAGMHHLEAGRFDLGQALQRFIRTDDTTEAIADRGWIIGTVAAGPTDALHAPLRQHRLLRHIQHAVFEGSATDVGYQTFHWRIMIVLDGI